ncbi:photosynthetic complex assembly protein [Rhodospirillum rubrum]|uniref:photosynthetic complex putative assembly protein PuhB n=1 Tax=Rhodospirillum rubrum TaxID=1085 RepID=UPI00190527FC|nr:photosynthetic complex putative assembly protein PuhB [Rhodospirillum rubrum]MBK1665990.1 photosynthetic complex assembly protein [Rhodospirillum rubrum]MBK1677972.1 photosynthetic complex assembly protein [Rhodospirillum rubrum]
MDEYDSEPIRGLPADLPPGEFILWQGAPTRRALALRVFHIRLIALYFAILVAWNVASALYDGHPLPMVLTAGAVPLIPGAIVLGLIWLYAHLIAKTTLYTITSKRLVFRFGVALPRAVNIPFKVITGANLKTYRDGTGDLPLTLAGKDRMAYLHIWPHARPWKLNKPEPMLRGIPDATEVAETLAGALKAYMTDPDPVRLTEVSGAAAPAPTADLAGSPAQ